MQTAWVVLRPVNTQYRGDKSDLTQVKTLKWRRQQWTVGGERIHLHLFGHSKHGSGTRIHL